MDIYIKVKIINSIVADLKKELLSIIDRTPESWDRTEITWVAKELMSKKGWIAMTTKRKQRFVEYKHFRSNNNL